MFYDIVWLLFSDSLAIEILISSAFYLTCNCFKNCTFFNVKKNFNIVLKMSIYKTIFTDVFTYIYQL